MVFVIDIKQLAKEQQNSSGYVSDNAISLLIQTYEIMALLQIFTHSPLLYELKMPREVTVLLPTLTFEFFFDKCSNTNTLVTISFNSISSVHWWILYWSTKYLNLFLDDFRFLNYAVV